MYTLKELLIGNRQTDSLVIMSGGVDSTLILLKEVVRVKKEGEGKINVLYHKSGLIVREKGINEEQSIRNIIEKIKIDYDIDISLVFSTLDMFIDGEEGKDLHPFNFRYDYTNMMLPQSTLWTSIILQAITMIRCVDVNVIFGFNLNDNLEGYSANMMKKTIESFYELVYMGEGKMNVIFPLLNRVKENIYSELLSDFYDYYNLTWTCESPHENRKECGICTPCITKHNTLLSVLNHRGLNKRVKMTTMARHVKSKYSKEACKMEDIVVCSK